MADYRFNFILAKLYEMLDNEDEQLINIYNDQADKTVGEHISSLEELGSKPDDINTNLYAITEYILEFDDDSGCPAIRAIMKAKSLYGPFEETAKKARKLKAQYANWLKKCEKLRADNPSAEEDPALLPPCPASTSALLDADRVIELWDNVYTRLTPNDIMEIARYPITMPDDISYCTTLKHNYPGLSWTEIMTLLRSVKSALMDMNARVKRTIKDVLNEAYIGQSELSVRFGIPIRTVQNWAEGKRQPPEWVVRLLAAALNVEE